VSPVLPEVFRLLIAAKARQKMCKIALVSDVLESKGAGSLVVSYRERKI
jgi:hypothetical protein